MAGNVGLGNRALDSRPTNESSRPDPKPAAANLTLLVNELATAENEAKRLADVPHLWRVIRLQDAVRQAYGAIYAPSTSPGLAEGPEIDRRATASDWQYPPMRRAE